MSTEKTSLEQGDAIFKLRNHSATERLVIDRVTDQMAYSGNHSFVRNQLEPIMRVTKETGYTKLFGESFELATPENSDKYIWEIRLRFIRNFEYHRLPNEELIKLENLLKMLNIK